MTSDARGASSVPTVAPYGSWVSPISAAEFAAGSHPAGGARFVGDEVWWLELRPAEGGRYAVRRPGADGEPEDVLPAPWNARTRVHEYGGGAWTATPDGLVVFAEFGDQRLYRLDEPGGSPVPLTPEPPSPGAWRYGELQLLRVGEVWCVRERHDAGGTVSRDLVAVPLGGEAAEDESAIRHVAGGSHFLAGARISPDGATLAWIAWEHPQMPWDGTELRVAALDAAGVAGEPRTLIGSTTESVLQPEWGPDGSLYAISDRTGWWNLYRVPLDGGAPEPLHPLDAEFADALWQLGMSLVPRAARRPAAHRPHLRHRHPRRARPGQRHADRPRPARAHQHLDRAGARGPGAAGDHGRARAGRRPATRSRHRASWRRCGSTPTSRTGPGTSRARS